MTFSTLPNREPVPLVLVLATTVHSFRLPLLWAPMETTMARLTWMAQRMASTTPRLTWMASTKARSTAPWTRMVLPMEQTMARASWWHRAIAIIIQLKTPGMGACNSTEGGPEGSDFCRIFRSCFFATLHSFRLSYGIFDTSQQTTSATSTSTRHNGPLLSSSSSLGTDGTDDGSLDLDGPADCNVEARLTWMSQRMASTTPRLTWMASTKARSTAR
jgi:hypothetical protein